MGFGLCLKGVTGLESGERKWRKKTEGVWWCIQKQAGLGDREIGKGMCISGLSGVGTRRGTSWKPAVRPLRAGEEL